MIIYFILTMNELCTFILKNKIISLISSGFDKKVHHTFYNHWQTGRTTLLVRISLFWISLLHFSWSARKIKSVLPHPIDNVIWDAASNLIHTRSSLWLQKYSTQLFCCMEHNWQMARAAAFWIWDHTSQWLLPDNNWAWKYLGQPKLSYNSAAVWDSS